MSQVVCAEERSGELKKEDKEEEGNWRARLCPRQLRWPPHLLHPHLHSDTVATEDEIGKYLEWVASSSSALARATTIAARGRSDVASLVEATFATSANFSCQLGSRGNTSAVASTTTLTIRPAWVLKSVVEGGPLIEDQEPSPIPT